MTGVDIERESIIRGFPQITWVNIVMDEMDGARMQSSQHDSRNLSEKLEGWKRLGGKIDQDLLYEERWKHGKTESAFRKSWEKAAITEGITGKLDGLMDQTWAEKPSDKSKKTCKRISQYLDMSTHRWTFYSELRSLSIPKRFNCLQKLFLPTIN